MSRTSFRYAWFVVMLLGAMLGGLTQTAVNTSMSAIMAEMGISVTLSQWLTTIFQLCLGIVIPLSAYLVGRFSVRGLYLFAMTIFCAGSLIGYFSPVFPVLFVGRILQACTTGIALPLIQVVTLSEFPVEHRGAAMGVVGLTMGFAPNVGPTIAGALTTAFGWRSCFLGLAMFSGLIIVLALFFVRVAKHGIAAERRLDLFSVVLSSFGFGGLLLGFSNASDFGMLSMLCWLPLAIGIVCLVWFYARQRRIESPLIRLEVFKTRDFLTGTVIICFIFGAFIGVTLLIPLYIQEILHQTALVSGLVLLPGTAAALVISPLAGVIMDRIGTRPIVLVGSVLMVLGTVMLVRMGNVTSLVYIVVWQTVRTFGITALIMPVTTWSLAALPKNLVADGTSATNALRQTAGALSIAIMVLLSTLGVVGGVVTSAGVDYAMMFSLVLSVLVMVCGAVFVKAGKLGVNS